MLKLKDTFSSKKTMVILTIVISLVIIISVIYIPDGDESEKDETDWRNYPYMIPDTDLRFPEVEGSIDDPDQQKWISVAFELEFLEVDREEMRIILFYHPEFKGMYLFDFENDEIDYDKRFLGEMFIADGKMDMKFENPGYEMNDTLVVKEGRAFEYNMKTLLPFEKKTYELNLSIESNKPPATQYDGSVKKSKLFDEVETIFTEFDLTDCDVNGQIKIDGESKEVVGHGWLEHLWGENIPMDWRWFGFWTDFGVEMEIVDFVDEDLDFIMEVRPDGDVNTIDDVEIEITSVKEGFGYTWEIVAEEHDIYLNVTLKEEMSVYFFNSMIGWGSVKGEIRGQQVDTLTYVEVIK
ncbi:MAG: lipocalin-like domain-containing protein [Candidatus Saliniplasma sp.]